MVIYVKEEILEEVMQIKQQIYSISNSKANNQ